MTCHIGFLGDQCSCLLSDSQATSGAVEAHGSQKQYIGDGFLVGVAGAADVGTAVLELLATSDTKPTSVNRKIIAFLRKEVNPEAAAAFEAVVVTSTGSTPTIDSLRPSRFCEFRSNGVRFVTGSGAPFVQESWRHEQSSGLATPQNNPADLLLRGTQAMATAFRSLTVDDRLFVGLTVGGKSYPLVKGDISIMYADKRLRDNLAECMRRVQPIFAMCDTIIGELREAHRRFSLTIHGLGGPTNNYIAKATQTISAQRSNLEQEIGTYCTWFDSL